MPWWTDNNLKQQLGEGGLVMVDARIIPHVKIHMLSLWGKNGRILIQTQGALKKEGELKEEPDRNSDL